MSSREVVDTILKIEKNIQKLSERQNIFKWKLVNNSWKKKNSNVNTIKKSNSLEYDKHYIRLQFLLTEYKNILRNMRLFPKPPSITIPSNRFLRTHHKKLI